MYDITPDTLMRSLVFLRQVNLDAEVHTVTFTANGGTGQVDMKIEGTRWTGGNFDPGEDLVQTFAI